MEVVHLNLLRHHCVMELGPRLVDYNCVLEDLVRSLDASFGRNAVMLPRDGLRYPFLFAWLFRDLTEG